MKTFLLVLLSFISSELFSQIYQPENLRVYNGVLDQSETAITVNPNNQDHLMLTFNDHSIAVGRPGYSFSTNGGENWITGFLVNFGYDYGLDPSCSFDNNGISYYNFVGVGGPGSPGPVIIAKTTNDGIDWTFNQVSNASERCDKPYMTIDNNPLSEFAGRIYVAFTLFNPPYTNGTVKLSYSSNQGISWTENSIETFYFNEPYLPHFIYDEEISSINLGAVPITAPNSNLYICYAGYEQLVLGDPCKIHFAKSTDGGNTFQKEEIATIGSARVKNIGGIHCNSGPSIIVHPTSGNIYIAFTHGKSEEDDVDIYYMKSTDEGETWNTPILATETENDYQFFPWLSINKSGIIYLTYQQGTSNCIDTYVREIFDRGDDSELIFPSIKVSSHCGNPYVSAAQNDYIGAIGSSRSFNYPVWGDYRTGNQSTDIYIARYESDLRFAYENKSLDHTATSLNGQRKLAKDSNGNYHIVFSSNGEIFTRKSTNNGNSWQAPVRLSDGTGENKFPSISTMDNYLFITWQQYLGLDGSQHKYKIKGVYTSMTGWSPMTINDDEVYFSSPTDPLPVIVAAENIDNNYSSTDGLPEVMIAYRNSDGIYHINLFAWSPESLIYYYSQQGSDHKIPNTSTGYRNPSITVNGLGEIMLTCDYMGNIYAFLTTGGSWSSISSSIFQSTYIFSNTKSSVTSDALNYFHISWQGENWVYQTNSILHKKISTSGGIGTPITEFRNNQYMSFQPSTFGHLDANGGVTLYWYTGDDLDIKKVINDGTRWDHSSTEFIPSIQTNARFVNSIDKDLPEDFAYCWTSAGDIPYDCNTCIGCEENQEDFGGSDSIKTFRRAEFSNSALDAILSLQLGNFQLMDVNNNSYPLEPEELDANFTFQNFSDVLNVLFSDSIPRSNLYRKIAFEYEAVIKNLSKIKAINSNNVSLKLKLIDRTTGNTLYTSDAYTLPLDSIKRTISGNLTIPFNRLNQRYDLSVKLILEGVADEYLNQTANINLVNTYLSGSEYLGKQNETKNNTSKLTDYKLEQNYPNPFNPNTQIKYSVAEDGLVTIKVYDILGREIVVLVNEEKQAGSYSIGFDASHLSSGIYFYQVKTNNFIDTKKMILLR